MNDYYTHRPYLIETLNKFNYDNKINILEFGVGEGSSEIFFEYANKYPNLNVCAFDNEFNWFNSMKDKYELPNYKFNFVESWDTLFSEYKFMKTYDLVFVDQSPWEARITTLDILKGYYQNAILHDYDFYNKGIVSPEDIYNVNEATFFSRYLDSYELHGYNSTLPPTLLLTKLPK